MTNETSEISIDSKDPNAQSVAKVVPSRQQKKIKRTLFLAILSVMVFGGLGTYGFHWYHYGRFEVETDNAYIAGNQVQIMSEISGMVMSINVDNTDFVLAGDVLVELDKTDAKQAFEKAKSVLASQVRQARQSIINLKQYEAIIAQKNVALQQAKNDLSRRQTLGISNAIGGEELQHAKDAVTLAQAALDETTQQYNANLALVLSTPIEKQPSVVKASTELKEAWLALERTTITSPVTGYVSRRSVQLGAQIAPNTPLMAIVPADNLWVDANFKETQLNQMRIGQKAKVITDIYGKDVIYEGTIKGIEMGTGSVFSLLPAQNATGNWIKIVQRVPVRIELDPKELKNHPLRIGLSSTVIIDTRDQSGPILAAEHPKTTLYKSAHGQFDMTPIEALITQIIKENG